MIRVLLVDHDPGARSELAISLSGLGLAVSEAETGDDALAKAQAECPDVILLGRHAPEMDGFEVLRKLRECPATRRTPAVVFTGLPVPERETLVLELGATTYLPEPWNIDTLEATVRTAIREGVAATEETGDEAKNKEFRFLAGSNFGAQAIPYSQIRA